MFSVLHSAKRIDLESYMEVNKKWEVNILRNLRLDCVYFDTRNLVIQFFFIYMEQEDVILWWELRGW